MKQDNHTTPGTTHREGTLSSGQWVKLEGGPLEGKRGALKEVLGWIAFFAIVWACLMSASCGHATEWPRITIGKKLRTGDGTTDHSPADIEVETLAAIEWYAIAKGHDPQEFAAGLTVKIREDVIHHPDFGGGEVQLNGLFVAPYVITVRWFEGVGNNSLIHELLHYELFKYTGFSRYPDDGHQKYHGHTRKFLDEVDSLRHAFSRDWEGEPNPQKEKPQ